MSLELNLGFKSKPSRIHVASDLLSLGDELIHTESKKTNITKESFLHHSFLKFYPKCEYL